MSFASVGVVGAGLIGGSIALRLRDLGVHVVVRDPDPATREAAAASGLETGDAATLAACDLVVLASPLDVLDEAMAQLSGAQGPVVIDVGSVKTAPAAAAARAGLAGRYVGCHPMSGTEESGFAHADAELVVDVTWAVVWPDPAALPHLLAVVTWLIEAFAATVVLLDAPAHDRAAALVSHAPHVLAHGLLGLVEDADSPAARHLTAGSFRDGTRVAGRNPGRTHNMLSENAAELAVVLDDLITALSAYRRDLDDPDGPGLGVRLHHVAERAASVRVPQVDWREVATTRDLGVVIQQHVGQPLLLRSGGWAPLT